MSSSAATLSRLQQRALEADQIIDKLKSQLHQVRQAAGVWLNFILRYQFNPIILT
jgi:hypothetical protein